jgi:hypothetical protein
MARYVSSETVLSERIHTQVSTKHYLQSVVFDFLRAKVLRSDFLMAVCTPFGMNAYARASKDQTHRRNQ